jgi:hypothetical protein
LGVQLLVVEKVQRRIPALVVLVVLVVAVVVKIQIVLVVQELLDKVMLGAQVLQLAGGLPLVVVALHK